MPTAEKDATWTPSDHDPVCAALSHDEPDSCTCGLYDDTRVIPPGEGAGA